MELRVGTAGWTIPADVRDRFATSGTQLERYARVFSCVEINSSFYRPHRAATYARWARSVPDAFRFALKLPKTITHERRFIDCETPLAEFLAASSALGDKRDVLLVQLPPSFALDEGLVAPFFTMFCEQYAGRIACEPRHRSWFTPAGEAVLEAFAIARVAAEPVVPGGLPEPGGSSAFRYTRLHGSPHVYSSSYDADALADVARTSAASPVPNWCIFDNTARGAATANALTLLELLDQAEPATGS